MEHVGTMRWSEPRWVIVWAAAATVALLTVAGAGARPIQLRPDGTSVPATKDASCVVGTKPGHPAFDPVNHYVYVPNIGSGNVSVVKPLCTVVATLTMPAGANPRGAVFDPVNNDVYVTDSSLNQVYVISGTTLVRTITSFAFSGPWVPVFDPGNAAVVVPNGFSSTVSFIDPSNSVTTIAVGANPTTVGYDPFYGTLLVANWGSGNVTILNAVYLTHISDVRAGIHPERVAFDWLNQLDYVTNKGTNNVTVLNGLGVSYGDVDVGKEPYGVEWSQKSLDLYGANFGSHSVYVVHGFSVVKKINVSATATPYGEAYSSFNGQVYVTDFSSDLLYVYP